MIIIAHIFPLMYTSKICSEYNFVFFVKSLFYPKLKKMYLLHLYLNVLDTQHYTFPNQNSSMLPVWEWRHVCRQIKQSSSPSLLKNPWNMNINFKFLFATFVIYAPLVNQRCKGHNKYLLYREVKISYQELNKKIITILLLNLSFTHICCATKDYKSELKNKK